MELDRLRRERPELAEQVRGDFDARLAVAQDGGLRSSSAGLRATVSALVGAVEQALADESVVERDPPDEDARSSQLAADAVVSSI